MLLASDDEAADEPAPCGKTICQPSVSCFEIKKITNGKRIFGKQFQEIIHLSTETYMRISPDDSKHFGLETAPKVFNFVHHFLSDDQFRDLRAHLAGTWRARDVIRVGSVFSGWGVCEMVLECFQDCWNELFPEFQFEAMRLRKRPV